MLGTKKTVLFDIDKILAKISISEKQRVADLGCGNFGFFVFPLANLVGREGKIYAIDILKEALKEVKSQAESHNLPQVEPVWSDLEVFQATKIETASLDAATIINVLSQAIKKANILKEATRLIKNNGKMLIIDWKLEDIPLGPAPEKRISQREVKDICSRLGLKINEEFEAGPYHYGLVLTKL